MSFLNSQGASGFSPISNNQMLTSLGNPSLANNDMGGAMISPGVSPLSSIMGGQKTPALLNQMGGGVGQMGQAGGSRGMSEIGGGMQTLASLASLAMLFGA